MVQLCEVDFLLGSHTCLHQLLKEDKEDTEQCIFRGLVMHTKSYQIEWCIACLIANPSMQVALPSDTSMSCNPSLFKCIPTDAILIIVVNVLEHSCLTFNGSAESNAKACNRHLHYGHGLAQPS